MMRTVLGLLSMMLLLGVVSPDTATADNMFDIGAGLAVPIGDLNDPWNFSYSANATYLFELTPFVAAGASAGYHRMALDDEALLEVVDAPPQVSVDGGAFAVTTLCAELRLKSGAMDRALVYGCLGAGFNFLSVGDITLTDGVDREVVKFDGETRLGGYAGVGFAAPISPRMKIGAEARMNVFSTDADVGMGSLDESRQFWTIRSVLVLGL